jgi:hypothetical protein
MMTMAMLALAATLAPHRPVPVFTIDLDLPPEERYRVLLAPGTGFNATVWEFWNGYFARDKILTDALYKLVDARGEEAPEMMGELRGLSHMSKLPLKFVQGMQLFYELQTIMVPIVNITALPGSLASTINYTFHEAYPRGWEALVRFPAGPGCTGIIATNQADGSVSHARNLDFLPSSIMSKLVCESAGLEPSTSRLLMPCYPAALPACPPAAHPDVAHPHPPQTSASSPRTARRCSGLKWWQAMCKW